MTKNIFMSYSRRELGFVDDLVHNLEKENYHVWLDYRALTPGSSWVEQIDKGLEDSDTVLLVVSKAALSSEYVTNEWRHFLEKKQRVILLIFEAVDLPKELEKFEWVDFRGSYKAGLKELLSQLKKPIQENRSVPETGFKAPWIVWAAFMLSIVVAVMSLFEWWTLFVPWVLVPLPYRIFKRNFNFTEAQTALWALPIATILSIIVDTGEWAFDDLFLLIGLFCGAALLFILRSPAMQRWGKPEALVPKYFDPQDPKIQNPAPISFYVDHAVQDRVIAEDLIATLTKYGHPQAESILEAKAVFAIISRFKSDTEAVPDKQMLFPILTQTNDNLSKKLSKIQWIDFRPGVRGLDTIAQLLPDPKALLKAMGMRPVSSQNVYSPTITAIYYFILFMAIVNIGSTIHYILNPPDLDGLFSDEIIQLSVNIAMFGGLAYFMTRGLSSRKGFFSSPWFILIGLVGFGILTYLQIQLDEEIFRDLFDAGYMGEDYIEGFINYIQYIYFLGLVAIGLVYSRNKQDLRHWFPAK